MLIKIEERRHESPFVRYVATVSRDAADPPTEYSGSSPDEALGYAIREQLLIDGVVMKNGDLLLDGPLRVTLLQEKASG